MGLLVLSEETLVCSLCADGRRRDIALRSNYRFSQFSNWVSIFHGGTGTITVKEHTTGDF